MALHREGILEGRKALCTRWNLRKILEFWLDKLHAIREYCLPLYAKRLKEEYLCQN